MNSLSSRTRARVGALLLSIAASLMLLAANARATLYSAAGGYQHTGGSDGYWGEEFWGFGSARLDGGWYPFGRLTLVNDALYKWVLAPGGGIEKGIPGVGKARVGYTFYRGENRLADLMGTSHAYEVGLSRAFTPLLSGDIAYQAISGDLFAGANREFEGDGGIRLAPRHAVIHQLQGALGYDWNAWGRKVRVEGVWSAAKDTGRRRFMSETLSASVPLYGPLALQAEGTLVQAKNGLPRYFLGGGVAYAIAGRWIRGTPD